MNEHDELVRLQTRIEMARGLVEMWEQQAAAEDAEHFGGGEAVALRSCAAQMRQTLDLGAKQ